MISERDYMFVTNPSASDRTTIGQGTIGTSTLGVEFDEFGMPVSLLDGVKKFQGDGKFIAMPWAFSGDWSVMMVVDVTDTSGEFGSAADNLRFVNHGDGTASFWANGAEFVFTIGARLCFIGFSSEGLLSIDGSPRNVFDMTGFALVNPFTLGRRYDAVDNFYSGRVGRITYVERAYNVIEFMYQYGKHAALFDALP